MSKTVETFVVKVEVDKDQADISRAIVSVMGTAIARVAERLDEIVYPLEADWKITTLDTHGVEIPGMSYDHPYTDEED